MRELGALGYQVALDTNWPPQDWSCGLRAEVGTWISSCEHVLLNELEVSSLADSPDLTVAIDRLTPCSNRRHAGGENRRARRHRHPRRPPLRLRRTPATAIFDTIGAGDSFNAGYLARPAQRRAWPIHWPPDATPLPASLRAFRAARSLAASSPESVAVLRPRRRWEET